MGDDAAVTPDPTHADVSATIRAAETPQSRSVSLIVIATILVFGALYFARDFFIPVAFAVLLSLVLSPIVRWLARWHLPYPAAAALVLALAIGAVGGGGYALVGPVRAWVVAAPIALPKAARKLRAVVRPVEQVSRAATQVEQATGAASGAASEAKRDVVIEGPSLGSRVAGTSAVLLGGILEVLLLLYSLLAVGDLFLQKLVEMLPRRGDREKAVSIARATEASISGYLGLTALINVSEGAVVAAAMALVGMPTPLAWGALVAVVEFIPYVGMLAMMAILTAAALTTFDTVGHVLVVPAIYLGINFVQGNVVTPLVMSRRLTLNPVAIFVSLALWWWLWGIAGALLAVPMLAAFKILCDHVESLASIGAFIGDRESSERRNTVRARLSGIATRRRSRPVAAVASDPPAVRD
jgi:predicted PurR-regulated permease PerM